MYSSIRSFFLFIWRLLRALFNIMLMLLLMILLIGAGLYYHYSKNLPEPQQLEDYHPSETTRIYARDGQTLLYELVDPQSGRRTLVPFDLIPHTLKEATIAVEDAHFYKHPGVDWRGIIRALWLNYQHHEIVSGGSTITQQLVRSILLPAEELRHDLPLQQRYERKLREAILSYRVSRTYSKDDILTFYLNEVYYGAQAYGVEAAARTYFGKHVWELTLAESTLLAGLPQSPTRLNPFTNREGARARQRITLNLMVKNSYLTPMQADAIYNEPIHLVPPTTNIVAPHFVFYVRDILERAYSPDILYRGGLRVITTLDANWQAEAQRIAQQHIAELQHQQAHNAAVVILSPEGQILAMLGSIDYNNPAIDGEVNVALSPRQPGSALKPILYAVALKHGWTPATIIWDEPTTFEQPLGGSYDPMNYDNSWHGPQSVRMALANSLNIPAVKALDYVGIKSFVAVLQAMGISTLNDPWRYGLAMALGSNEVLLLELTVAYNTLRNSGRYHPSTAILKIENSQGNVLHTWNPSLGQQTLGPHGRQIAYLITDILSDNEARWYMFGQGNVMELPDKRPAAVKTGTSNDWRDSWTIGYTPDVTVGVWVGNNDNTPMQEIAGSNGAGLIWRDVMSAYHAYRAPKPFERPDGVVEKTICVDTGTMAGEACPHVGEELFVAGIEPPEADVVYQTVNVAGDGSCLAASYSPPDEVRPVQFVVYPPKFRDWAARNGIPQPPTQPCPQSLEPEHAVALLNPVSATGTVSSSLVVVSGIARYPYTLDVGTGAEPQTWNAISQGGGNIHGGPLGVWMPNEHMPGEYTLRLRATMPEGIVIETRQTVQYHNRP